MQRLNCVTASAQGSDMLLFKGETCQQDSWMKYSSILTKAFLRCIDKGFGRKALCCFRLPGKSVFCKTLGWQCPGEPLEVSRLLSFPQEWHWKRTLVWLLTKMAIPPATTEMCFWGDFLPDPAGPERTDCWIGVLLQAVRMCTSWTTCNKPG